MAPLRRTHVITTGTAPGLMLRPNVARPVQPCQAMAPATAPLTSRPAGRFQKGDGNVLPEAGPYNPHSLFQNESSNIHK